MMFIPGEKQYKHKAVIAFGTTTAHKA